MPTQALAAAARVAALMLLAGNACAQYAVSQLPALTATPPTNLVMMIDDSGSMQSAFVPDGLDQYAGTRRFTSSTFNALSYNPSVTYTAPALITSSGTATPLTSSFNAAPIDGFDTSATTVDLSAGYQPTTSATPGSSNQNFAAHPNQDLNLIFAPAAPPAGGGGGAPAYYYVYKSTLAGCTSMITDDNCYQYIRVGASEQQNFANWYSFYRTRHLMIASAAALAMADPGLTQARVTWRALSTCTSMTNGSDCAGWDSAVVDNRIRTFTGTQRSNFYQWLSRVPANQSTPTRSTWRAIGDYFSSTSLGANGPYGINPNPLTGTATGGEIACVQNFNITLTDGQWNGDNNGQFFGTADNSPATFPDTKAYSPSTMPPTAIYSNDPNRDTLSDIAFHYWATNLRPDLANSTTAVPPYMPVTTGVNGAVTTADYWNPQNDPATWPHLVQITIGVGMTSTMTAPGLPWWGNDVNTQYASTGYMNLWSGNNAWPAINNNAGGGDMGKAYDLWHAAINSRGLAFSAESPADLRNALGASLNRIKASMAAQSAVATSSSSLNNGTVVFEASFASSDWHGVVSALGITSGAINTTPKWTTLNTGSFAPASTRTIITSRSGTPAAGNGIQFSSSDTAFNAIWAGVTGANANVLAWLRGDQTNERPTGTLRARKITVLGDVVDSAPVFAWHENFGYAGLPEGMSATPNYTTYISTKANAAGTNYQGTGMVYVGANDGMLHGFDANSGVELFGYVPHSVIPNLPALADPGYSHQFYVDQTPYVGDACVGSGPTSCSWKTVLVGTTGAGGQGVFAIDVTSPASMEAGSSAAASVLWDLDGYSATNTSGDPDLGYPIGKPIVARLNNGDWAAVFGNGYLSKNGCAVLFIVRLSDGAMTKIGTTGAAGTTVCNAPNPNASTGLGPVTLSDVDGNMTTDFVYAGDLQGNLWKFDLSSASSGSWTVGLGGQPLFAASPGCTPAATSTAASTCQPITSAPVLGPALPGLTGTMVYVGTGRMFAVGDLTTTSTQSFYGILDSGASVSSSALVQEVITSSGGTRTVTANAVAPPKKGWFMNLPDTGERVTMSPLLIDNFVVFATEVPTSDSCSAGGSGWIMAVSATTNTVGGSDFFVGSPGINGIQSTVGVIQGITVLSDSTHSQDRFLAGGTQGVQTFATAAFSVKGRISWHELTR